VTKSFFKILNVSAYPTLFANSRKYPGLSVVSGNFETRSNTVQVQTNKTSGYDICLVTPLDICSGIQAFLWFLEVLRLDPNTVQVQSNKTSGYEICLVLPPP
jgi:hypothetical protein